MFFCFCPSRRGSIFCGFGRQASHLHPKILRPTGMNSRESMVLRMTNLCFYCVIPRSVHTAAILHFYAPDGAKQEPSKQSEIVVLSLLSLLVFLHPFPPCLHISRRERRTSPFHPQFLFTRRRLVYALPTPTCIRRGVFVLCTGERSDTTTEVGPV